MSILLFEIACLINPNFENEQIEDLEYRKFEEMIGYCYNQSNIIQVSGGLRRVCLRIWCTIYDLCYAWLRVVTNNRRLPFLTAEPCNLRRRVVTAPATMAPSEKRGAKPTSPWTLWDICWLCM